MKKQRGEVGQMYTIEAIASAFIMIIVLVIVVQTTSLTPLSSSFTNQHIKLELQNLGNDILVTLDETPAMSNTTGINETSMAVPSLLKRSVIDWAVFSYYDTYTWNGTAFISQYNGSVKELNTPLTSALKFALTNNSIAYNVEIGYPDPGGYNRVSKMIWNGDPSENSVTVSRFIVLHNNRTEIPPGDRFDGSATMPVLILPDIGGGAYDFHTVIEVRLTLWVM
ncbi:DUF7288 family protein [Methanocella arvoryzae]|uniref:Uncharacterized protein n=1 Tax=Methanocella arvoryzae (strain DSM 22066 / NBRC 105507 / MRE50) TaxID=351160 RepID=Q0W743_METAR|nr:hypothetical protein [Methanocella arvoryzae]CAJ35800.1 hypothetical protein RCIX349 [Methanocella arvoryzae MRE50]